MQQSAIYNGDWLTVPISMPAPGSTCTSTPYTKFISRQPESDDALLKWGFAARRRQSAEARGPPPSSLLAAAPGKTLAKKSRRSQPPLACKPTLPRRGSR